MNLITDALVRQGINPSSQLFGESPYLPQAKPKLCHCPPPTRNRLGGCQPRLQWADDQLVPYCLTCGKALVKGQHRRRDQTLVISLAEQYRRNAADVDLDDLRRDPPLLIED